MVTMELDNFSLEQICDSGQCFRMKKNWGEYLFSGGRESVSGGFSERKYCGF